MRLGEKRDLLSIDDLEDSFSDIIESVSYTHLRAHETP